MFAINCTPTWGARFGGFRNRACSCAHATGAPTMRTEVELQAHQSEGYSRMTPRSLTRAIQINAGQMPTLSNTAKLVQIENAQGGSPCAG